jgi:hypothetical protein
VNTIERRFTYLIPVALLLVEAVTLLFGPHVAPHHYLNPINKNADFTVAAVVVTLFALRRANLVQVLAVGLLFEGLRIAFLGWHRISVFDSLSSTGLGFWVAALLLAGLRALSTQGAERVRAVDMAAITFALPASLPLLGAFLWLTDMSLPYAYDNFLYAFDGLLPVPVARIAAANLAQHPWIASFFWLIYHSLIGVFALYVVLQGRSDAGMSGRLISQWLVAGFLGYAIYFLMPAVGPKVTFGSAFPFDFPDPNGIKLALMLDPGEGPRNAMPSLHATWAFLIVLSTRNMSALARAGALMFMIATLISTVGLGEHYVVDLVVAVPFTLAVDGIVSCFGLRRANPRAVTAAIGGIAMTCAWLLMLRYGIGALRGAPWLATWLVLGTIAASGWLLRRQLVSGRDLIQSNPGVSHEAGTAGTGTAHRRAGVEVAAMGGIGVPAQHLGISVIGIGEAHHVG